MWGVAAGTRFCFAFSSLCSTLCILLKVRLRGLALNET